MKNRIPRIVKLKEKKLIGQHVAMSLSQNTTKQLWEQFAPKIKEIENRLSQNKISLQIYPDSYYKEFKLDAKFVKWAAVEVSCFGTIPKLMKSFIIPEGLYAVFKYTGLSSDNSFFNYIFSEWLPNSNYEIDTRPHFEVLGKNYKNNDIYSEEDIWIPINKKVNN